MFFSRNKSVQIILFPVKSPGINQTGTLKHRDNGILYICIFIISIIQFVQVLVFSATLNNISAISWPTLILYICIFIISIIQFVQVLVFSATLNNISAISWLLILLVEKSGIPGENH